MSLFNFNYFGSKEREELKALREENARLQREADKREEEVVDKSVVEAAKNQEQTKPYSRLIMSGDIITVILQDGTPLSKAGMDVSIIDAIKRCISEDEIKALLFPKPVHAKMEASPIEEDDLDILRGNEDFIIEGERVYLKGVKLELPPIVLASFIQIEEQLYTELSASVRKQYSPEDLFNQYEALKAFTYKLFLCPVEEGRNSLLQYIQENFIRITPSGNFIGFRRVNKVGTGNKQLIEFVSSQYFKLKKWKKSPKNYYVFANYGCSPSMRTEQTEMTYSIESSNLKSDYQEILGTLEDLYLKLPDMEENRYTDDRTSTYDIRIGATYKIREEDLTLNRKGSCGGALHIADGVNYDYSGFGDTPVIAIINPMHVVKTDTGYKGKIGVKEMFIAKVTSFDEEGNYVDIDDEDLVNFDEMYHNETVQELEEAIRSKSFDILTVKEEVSPVSIIDLRNITAILKNRIQQVV